MTALCIITARGGSKRIPRKNIRSFCGEPIIRYPIDAALKSGLFDTVMISTDDEEIGEIAKGLGATVPFLRSPSTSNDFATTADVLLEVLSEFQRLGQNFDFLCCCYPTAPFITPTKLQAAFKLLKENKAASVIPVAEYSTPIFRALTLKNCRLSYLWPENESKRSQDLPPTYYDTGQFYFVKVARFRECKTLITEDTLGLPIPTSECQDIDTEADWELAELKYQLWKNRIELEHR